MPFNEMTDGSDLNQVLTRRFGIQGAPSPNMASEFFPNIVLEAERPEWGFLSGERHYSINGADAAGGVGVYSHLHLFNPSGSGIIAVIEKVIMRALTTQDVLIYGWCNTNANDGASYARSLDSREVTRRSACQMGTFTGVASVNRILGEWSPPLADDSLPMCQGIVLGPGSEFIVRPTTDNIGLQGMIQWRERAATQGELRSAEAYF